MLDLTFLNEDQIFGSKALEIFKKYGTKCAISDFAILLGGYAYSQDFTNEGTDLKDRTGWWWLKTHYDNDVYVVGVKGISDWYHVYTRNVGVRPALPYSSISKKCSKEVENSCGVVEVTFGEYPQTIAGQDISLELEESYNNKCLKATGKTYTTDSIELYDIYTNFKAQKHIEYEYKGSKYIRFVADSRGEDKILSDGTNVQDETAYWVKVEPITWLVDKKANIALTKKSILSGIQFTNERNYKGKFKKTNIKRFMNKYLSKEIIPQKPVLKYQDKFKFELFNHGQKLESTLDITNIKDEEINKLIKEIYKLIALMSDEDKTAIKSKIDSLLNDYLGQIESFNPNYDPIFEISLTLTDNPDALRADLLAKLEGIKSSLYNAENIQKYLLEIDEYRNLIKQEVVLLPSFLDSVLDEIKTIIVIARNNKNKTIEDELNAVLDNARNKLSNSIKRDILNESKDSIIDIHSILEIPIRDLLIKSANFSFISAELNKRLEGIIKIINSLDDKNKEKYTKIVEDLKNKYGFGSILTKDTLKSMYNDILSLNSEILSISSRSIYFANILNTINSFIDSNPFENNNTLIPSLITNINSLLNDTNISSDKKDEFTIALNSIIAKWQGILLNGDIDSIIESMKEYNPNYANLNDYFIIELAIALDLNKLINEINSYKEKNDNYMRLKRNIKGEN